MKYYPIGSSLLKGSEICFGCAGIGGYDYGPVDDKTSIKALRKAADLGINFFDTADVYGFGRSEQILKKAFGPELNRFIIATKFGVRWDQNGKTSKDISPSHISSAIEKSLKRLNIDCIKLYQIHWPDNKTKWEDCIEKLIQLQSQGKILSYGICNVGLSDVSICQKHGDLSTLQVPFSMIDQRNQACMNACIRKNSISTMAYNVLGNGLLTGKYDLGSRFVGTDLRTRVDLFKPENLKKGMHVLSRVRNLAEKHRKSCVDITLAWTLAQRVVSFAIVGAKTPEQIEQSALATEFNLTKPELEDLTSATHEFLNTYAEQEL